MEITWRIFGTGTAEPLPSAPRICVLIAPPCAAHRIVSQHEVRVPLAFIMDLRKSWFAGHAFQQGTMSPVADDNAPFIRVRRRTSTRNNTAVQRNRDGIFV